MSGQVFGSLNGNFKHGHSQRPESPTYRTWMRIRSRCTNRNEKCAKNYVERGIAVCERWQSFENFLADMGERPEGRFSIERKDPNKGYEPSNCKWLRLSEQNRNKTTSKRVEAFGERMLDSDLAARLGLSRPAICVRRRRLAALPAHVVIRGVPVVFLP